MTIKNLIADDVKIRVLGDFAIIHGRTSYTTPDGKQAYGRYTDCWARQNGRWLAVVGACRKVKRERQVRTISNVVMPGLVPGIHVLLLTK